ncbi:hypothetical protein JHK82_042650 [Glycine max]|nr:hypothetical protein JHK82_042650 [Glycine max]
MLKIGDSAKVVIKQDMKGRKHKYGFNNNKREKTEKKRVVDDETGDKHELNQSRLQRNLVYLAAIADSQPQPSPLAGQPFSVLQQQQGMHNQLGMSSSGSQGLHMLQSEATNVGGNVTIGTGGGFPDFVRIGSGKQDIGISSEGRGGNSSGHSGDGGETLNYLKAAGDGN